MASKVLKNTTGSDIFIGAAGITIPASGQVSVDQSDYLMVAADDVIAELTPKINSGDVVVNDTVGDLSAADGINYLKYPDVAENIRFPSEPERSNGFSAKTLLGALEEVDGIVDTHAANAGNPHSTTFTQAVTADAGTNITAVEAEILTDQSDADSLHKHPKNASLLDYALFSKDNAAGAEHRETNSSSYIATVSFIFPGTTSRGIPQTIKTIASNSKADTSGNVKVFDVTNAATIAEKTAISGETKAIVDLGTLSNLPSGEAVFELQFKRNAGTGTFRLHAMAINF